MLQSKYCPDGAAHLTGACCEFQIDQSICAQRIRVQCHRNSAAPNLVPPQRKAKTSANMNLRRTAQYAMDRVAKVTDLICREAGTVLPDLTEIAGKNNGVFPFNRIVEIIDGRLPAARANGPTDMPIWGDRYKIQSRNLNPDYNSEAFVRAKIFMLAEYIYRLQANEFCWASSCSCPR